MCQLNTAEMKKQIGCIDVLSQHLVFTVLTVLYFYSFHSFTVLFVLKKMYRRAKSVFSFFSFHSSIFLQLYSFKAF